jgi:cystathionine beta-lyase/cystathionine gamma-synthase
VLVVVFVLVVLVVEPSSPFLQPWTTSAPQAKTASTKVESGDERTMGGIIVASHQSLERRATEKDSSDEGVR